MRALIIEDDQTIADFVARGLREAGFAVDHEADGEAGLTAAVSSSYDVAIVDLMLPKRDGLSLIEELRRRGVTTPRRRSSSMSARPSRFGSIRSTIATS